MALSGKNTIALVVLLLGLWVPALSQQPATGPASPARPTSARIAVECIGLVGGAGPAVIAGPTGPNTGKTAAAAIGLSNELPLWQHDLGDVAITAIVPAGESTSVLLLGSGPTKKGDDRRRPDHVMLWNGLEGWEIARVQLPPDVYAMTGAVSRDLSRMLVLENGERLSLWDVASGKRIRTYTPGRYMSAIALSADGQTALLGGRHMDEDVQLFDLELNQVRSVFRGHTGAVTCVSFTPDMQRVVSAALDGTVRVWDVRGGRCIWRLKGQPGLAARQVAFSPDGLRIAVIEGTAGDNTLPQAFGRFGEHARIWDLSSGRCSDPIHGHGPAVQTVAFAPDGRSVILGSSGGITSAPVAPALLGGDLRALETATAQEPRSYQVQCMDLKEPVCVRFSISRLLCGTGNNKVARWELPTWRPIGLSQPAKLQQWPSVQAISYDGRYALSSHLGHGGNEAWLWEIDSGLECSYRPIRGVISAVDITSDGLYAAIAYHKKDEQYRFTNNDISIIGRARNEEVAGSDQKESRVTALQFSPDSSMLVICRYGRGNREVCVWDLRSGAESQLQGLGDVLPGGLSFSADGKLLLCRAQGSLVLWDVIQAKVVQRVAIGNGVTASAISPDGKYAMTGGLDSNVRLWDMAQARELAVFEQHRAMVHSVAISRDGKFGASCAADDTVRVWDIFAVTGGRQ